MTTVLDNLLNRSLRFEYAGGSITTIHRPSDTGWRMLPDTVLTYQNSGTCRLSFRDKPSQTVTGRALIVLPPGRPHLLTGVSRTATYYWVHVNYYLLNDLDLFSFITVPPVITGRPADRIGKIIKAWHLLGRRSPTPDPLLLAARKNEMGFRLLAELSGQAKPDPQGQARLINLNQIWPALEQIHQHYSAPLDRDDLADRCTMSASQLHRVFHRAMGAGPMEYLRTVRLRQAQQILLTTEATIAEIARRVGYEDQFVFSRFFKRECGRNPTTYRRENKPESLWKTS